MRRNIYPKFMVFVVVEVCLMKCSGRDKLDEHPIKLMSVKQSELNTTRRKHNKNAIRK